VCNNVNNVHFGTGQERQMAAINRGRYTADVSGHDEVVVFLIGMRINRLWQFWRWLPVFVAMPRMMIELAKDRSLGLLGRPRTFVSGRVVLVLQYWDSFAALEHYARSREHRHLPAWRSFNRRIRGNGSVGIWHETYRVTAGSSETLYANMPAFGLAAATSDVPVGRGHQTAAQRIGVRHEDSPPIAPY